MIAVAAVYHDPGHNPGPVAGCVLFLEGLKVGNSPVGLVRTTYNANMLDLELGAFLVLRACEHLKEHRQSNVPIFVSSLGLVMAWHAHQHLAPRHKGTSIMAHAWEAMAPVAATLHWCHPLLDSRAMERAELEAVRRFETERGKEPS